MERKRKMEPSVMVNYPAARPAGFDVRVDAGQGPPTVEPAGQLDLGTVPLLTQALEKIEAGGPPVLVLDLRGVTFLDSTGLGAIIAAQKRANAAGRRLVLVRGSEQIQKIFRLVALEDYFEMVDEPPPGPD